MVSISLVVCATSLRLLLMPCHIYKFSQLLLNMFSQIAVSGLL